MVKKTPTTDAVDDEGYLCLKGEKFWRWRAVDAELRAANVEMESVAQMIQIEIAKNQELSNLLQRKAALVGTISSAKADLMTVQGEIEKDLGISLKDHSFDDRTGRLYHLANDGSQGKPVKQTKARARKARS